MYFFPGVSSKSKHINQTNTQFWYQLKTRVLPSLLPMFFFPLLSSQASHCLLLALLLPIWRHHKDEGKVKKTCSCWQGRGLSYTPAKEEITKHVVMKFWSWLFRMVLTAYFDLLWMVADLCMVNTYLGFQLKFLFILAWFAQQIDDLFWIVFATAKLEWGINQDIIENHHLLITKGINL